MEENLDLANIDIDLNEIDNVELDEGMENFGEVELTIDEPHIKISSDDLNRALSLTGSVIETTGNDLLSKAISIEVDKGEVIFKATNYTNYVVYKCPVINSTNLIEEPIIINYNLLGKVVKALGKQVAFIKKENGVYIRLVGGDLFLETISADPNKYVAPGEREDQIFEIEGSKLAQILKDNLILINQAIRPEDRKIVMTDQGFVFNSILISLKGNQPLGNLNLKKTDLEAVKKLASLNSEGNIHFYKVNQDKINRVLAVDDKGCSYSFVADSSVLDPQVLEQFNDPALETGVYVDLNLLYRWVEISTILPYSTQRINLNYNGSNVDLTVLTKRGDNPVVLQGSPINAVQPLAQPVSVQSGQLKNLLQSFAGNSSVLLSLGAKGIYISSNDYVGVLRYV